MERSVGEQVIGFDIRRLSPAVQVEGLVVGRRRAESRIDLAVRQAVRRISVQRARQQHRHGALVGAEVRLLGIAGLEIAGADEAFESAVTPNVEAQFLGELFPVIAKIIGDDVGGRAVDIARLTGLVPAIPADRRQVQTLIQGQVRGPAEPHDLASAVVRRHVAERAKVGRRPEAQVALDRAGLLVAGKEDIGLEGAAAVGVVAVVCSREPEVEGVGGRVARCQSIGLAVDVVIGSALGVLQEAVSLALQRPDAKAELLVHRKIGHGLRQSLTMVAQPGADLQAERAGRHFLESGNPPVQGRATMQGRLRTLFDLDAVDVEHLAIGRSNLRDRHAVLEEGDPRLGRRRCIVRGDAA